MKKEGQCERLIGPYQCGIRPAQVWFKFGKDPIWLCVSCWSIVQRDFEIAQEERRSREEGGRK